MENHNDMSYPKVKVLCYPHKLLSTNLFSGQTSVACYQIPTKGSIICVPPKSIPAYYHSIVKRQINQMRKKTLLLRVAVLGWQRWCLF